MKVFRFYYWLNGMITEMYIQAGSEEEARKKFSNKRDLENVIAVEEVFQ